MKTESVSIQPLSSVILKILYPPTRLEAKLDIIPFSHCKLYGETPPLILLISAAPTESPKHWISFKTLILTANGR